jgi:hypothetical protein
MADSELISPLCLYLMFDSCSVANRKDLCKSLDFTTTETISVLKDAAKFVEEITKRNLSCSSTCELIHLEYGVSLIEPDDIFEAFSAIPVMSAEEEKLEQKEIAIDLERASKREKIIMDLYFGKNDDKCGQGMKRSFLECIKQNPDIFGAGGASKDTDIEETKFYSKKRKMRYEDADEDEPIGDIFSLVKKIVDNLVKDSRHAFVSCLNLPLREIEQMQKDLDEGMVNHVYTFLAQRGLINERNVNPLIYRIGKEQKLRYIKSILTKYQENVDMKKKQK